MIVSSEYETVKDFNTGVRNRRVLVRNIAVLISFKRKAILYLFQWITMKIPKLKILPIRSLKKISSSWLPLIKYLKLT